MAKCCPIATLLEDCSGPTTPERGSVRSPMHVAVTSLPYDPAVGGHGVLTDRETTWRTHGRCVSVRPPPETDASTVRQCVGLLRAPWTRACPHVVKGLPC